ncbi:transmembrane and coiled-coil domain-containing protein 3-like isoform X1 [Salvelinus namaycush]|uniref:Transmembrane and coiled-coil domain-containing protein 3-like isoform X1 n=1 Tax=Salvelinus namaycush TaxID=8040 RepID=A0A8U0QAF1_SALNM|nr:transmembrane and coiled-coil domain-containing protein 3-like isoform X1 [Salvelinus namaycush]
MELGCFLAGALLSSQGQICTTEVMGCIEPIRDFLAIIFFASIGFHVFPTFVLYELTILVVLTLSLVIMKFLMAVLVLSAILPKGSRHIRWIVSAGLAQVSEFSFVLGSRARRAGIISREVYLLVLSVTTLSSSSPGVPAGSHCHHSVLFFPRCTCWFSVSPLCPLLPQVYLLVLSVTTLSSSSPGVPAGS